MARFKFKLDTVLEHRQRLEHECQRAVAIAVNERAEVQAELKKLDETVRTAMADLRTNHLTGEIDLMFLAAHRRFMLAMQRQGIALVEKRSEKQKAVDAAQLVLGEAMKQRKILEKLRDRQQERWREESNRKEMSENDEIAMQLSYAMLPGNQPAGGLSE